MMQTQREYLFGLGLAKNPVGRGRFSVEGHKALARSNGITFADDNKPEAKPKTVKVTKAATVIAKPTEKVDPKAVREWARAKGKTIGERGRIHSDIVAEYLAGTAVEDRPEIVGEFDVYRDSAPRRYPAGTRFAGTVRFRGKDESVNVNDRTVCVHCKVSLSGHLCQTPAIVVGYGRGDFVSVSPVYPKE
jgi:hypothetical protein